MLYIWGFSLHTTKQSTINTSQYSPRHQKNPSMFPCASLVAYAWGTIYKQRHIAHELRQCYYTCVHVAMQAYFTMK